MKKFNTITLILIIFLGLTTFSYAQVAMLQTNDFVGITFWLVSMAMIASTIFFFVERGNVAISWRTPVTVAGLITGVAFIHYMYIRGIWVQTNDTPTVYRYVDWLITIPLQILEFYLILLAVKKVSKTMLWKLLVASILMVTGGYLGEAGYIVPIVGFVILSGGWIYILFELFSGEAGKAANSRTNKPLKTAFAAMRMIVAIGWAVYPLGYLFGYLMSGIDVNVLNVIYNLSDFVNKIAFGLIIWSAAMQNTNISRR